MNIKHILFFSGRREIQYYLYCSAWDFFPTQNSTVGFKEQHEQLSFTCCYLEFYTKEVSTNESIKSRNS